MATSGLGKLNGKVALITDLAYDQAPGHGHTADLSGPLVDAGPVNETEPVDLFEFIPDDDDSYSGGASSGIGAATAKMFCQQGAEVAITGRNAENLDKVGDECDKLGHAKSLRIAGDITIETDVERIVEEAIKHFGRLDILVNNAGIGESGTIETTSLAQFDRVFNINVRAMYHVTMLAVPHLVKTKGNIVNVSSVNGVRSFPNVLAYNMSKSAVDQFTRCCALELAPKQVRVNSVNPGVIITEIHKRGGLDEEAYQKFLDRTKFTHALGRPGEVEEVSATIAFLASDNASFITGVQLPIDGGRHAMCPR